MGYQVQGAILTKVLPLTNLTLVGDYFAGVFLFNHGSVPVSRYHKCHIFSTWQLGHIILISQTRYLFFRFGKRIRECTFQSSHSTDALIECQDIFPEQYS